MLITHFVSIMKYKRIDRELYIHNRRNFANQLKPGALAVFNSNDVYPISADGTMPFEQHRDILYLSGVDQEESILVIFPDAAKEEHREVLFLRETNEHIAVWEGAKLNKEEAYMVSGIKSVFWLSEFEKLFKTLMAQADTVYINTNEHLRAHTEVETREDRFIKKLKEDYPAHSVAKSAPIMHRLRSIKHPLEVDLIQQACDITNKGFRRVLKFLRPGAWEYELEAEFMHEFLMNRSKGFAYTPIIGGGKNACVLHYIENNQQLKEGDLVLMDVGAEYANYASDMTRTVPVSGRYSERQKAVYNAVLKVKKECEKILVPGVMLDDYHKEVGLIMQAELLQLGLLDKADIQNEDPKWPAYKKYFMHGTSHFMGLDTHDVGLWTEPVKPGMVFTIEPGIYIPEENLGVRIENDYMVQENGILFDFMREIPQEVEEIEDLMN